tara:strand:- start:2793 stop:3059 length:267 start_codon:yes stop_codon:yes gene_type:complete
MYKIFQNTKAMLNYELKKFECEFEKKGYWYAEHNLSYSIYEMNGMQFEITNEGHGYFKWYAKGIANPYSGQAPTKSGALDIVRELSKY